MNEKTVYGLHNKYDSDCIIQTTSTQDTVAGIVHCNTIEQGNNPGTNIKVTEQLSNDLNTDLCEALTDHDYLSEQKIPETP